jgi:hypothetical protein
MNRRSAVRPTPRLDLRTDPWIAGLRVGNRSATALATSLRLDVHRPCTSCRESTWLHRRDLVAYDKGVPLLCAICVGDAFVEMRPRR